MNQHMPLQQNLGSSFRDPSGFLFRDAGVLYRQVNQIYQANYDQLIQSGLYKDLVRHKLLIPHQEVTLGAPRPDLVYRIIRPEALDFVSYPYEWSFSQYKDAALTTLKIQKLALHYGMSLKDSSAYNIQFHHGQPVLIDTLSFELYAAGQPWTPYRQFCQHFLAPLSLMAHVDVRMGQLMRVYIDGVPLDLVVKLLPFSSHFKLPLLLHLYLHAQSQRRYANKTTVPKRQMSKQAMLGLIDHLESGVKTLHWSPAGSEWGEYYELHNYSPGGLEFKERMLSAYLERVHPHSVWDLGANTGKFSRIAGKMNCLTIAFDFDPAAVEINYRQCVADHESHILPLVSDLTNPSPGIGWQNQERLNLYERGPADMLFALAIVHHLAISNNVPLERVAEFVQLLGRWLVIEFVPKSDSQVQRLLATRQDIFIDYHQDGFEQAFANYFVLHDRQKIPESERWLYLMEKR